MNGIKKILANLGLCAIVAIFTAMIAVCKTGMLNVSTISYMINDGDMLSVLYVLAMIILWELCKIFNYNVDKKFYMFEPKEAEVGIFVTLIDLSLAFLTITKQPFDHINILLFILICTIKEYSKVLRHEMTNIRAYRQLQNWLMNIKYMILINLMVNISILIMVIALIKCFTLNNFVYIIYAAEYSLLTIYNLETSSELLVHQIEQILKDLPTKKLHLIAICITASLSKIVLSIVFAIAMIQNGFLPLNLLIHIIQDVWILFTSSRLAINIWRALKIIEILPYPTGGQKRRNLHACPACLLNLGNWGKALQCGHVFHTFCLRDDLCNQLLCPLCGVPVRFNIDHGTAHRFKLLFNNYIARLDDSNGENESNPNNAIRMANNLIQRRCMNPNVEESKWISMRKFMLMPIFTASPVLSLGLPYFIHIRHPHFWADGMCEWQNDPTIKRTVSTYVEYIAEIMDDIMEGIFGKIVK